MAQLAKRAGLVKGTLYLYFKTREELFLTLYEESPDPMEPSFHQQPIGAHVKRGLCTGTAQYGVGGWHLRAPADQT